MEALLNIRRHSYLPVKGYNIESQVRGLRSFGVPAALYGNLLSSILMNKLPQELRLTISWEVQDEEWELDKLMNIEWEINAWERLLD